MPTTERTVATGTIPDPESLQLELVEAAPSIGATCTGVAVYTSDPAPGSDRVWMDFDLAPSDPAVDAVIAAHPVIAPGVTGAFPVAKGTGYKIFERLVPPGGHIALDVHVHAVLGSAASADPVFVDYYAVAWRNTVGSVQVSQPVGSRSGQIPSFSVQLVGTATSVRVEIMMQKVGTLHLLMNHVGIESEGVIP